MQPIHELRRDIARALHPRRCYVGRVHAERRIENEKHIHAAREDFLLALIPLGTRESEHEEKYRRAYESRLHAIARRAHTEREPVEKRQLAELFDRLTAPLLAPDEKPRERRQKQPQVERVGGSELHQGYLASRVRDKSASASRKPSASIMK